MSGSDIYELSGYSGTGTITRATFQQGVNNYIVTVDTYLSEANAGTSYGTSAEVQVDVWDGATDYTTQGLIRFDDIFGSGGTQIPDNVYTSSASMTVNVSDGAANITMHEMLTGWSGTSTWDSVSGGISTNDIEASSTAASRLSNPASSGSVTFHSLEDSIQAWMDGSLANNGWAIVSDSDNGWDMDSSESSNQPLLTVNYVTAGSQTSTVHTLTVDSASDVLYGDATSIDTLLANRGTDGMISLREAIWAANNTANVDGSTPDVINFAIGVGGSSQTIFVNAGGLPTITDAVVLDASTEGANQLITLDGTNAVNSTGGIVLRNNTSIVRGFNVINLVDEGIEIDGFTGFGDNHLIENNWAGVTAGGAAAGNVDDGILITEDADNNEIRNNVVGSSGDDGIQVRNNSDGNGIWGNTIAGNYIGSDQAGTLDRGNNSFGNSIDGSANIQIGGSFAVERNVVAANNADGISLWSVATTLTVIQGNYVGVHSTGNTALGNTADGIVIGRGSHNNTIGGDRMGGEGNVISGNWDPDVGANSDGIEFDNVGADNNKIYGSYIGTNFDGTVAIANKPHGVVIYNGVQSTQVGGTGTGQANIISGNSDSEILIDGNGSTSTSGNVIVNNLIGVESNGSSALGNGQEGIQIISSASDNLNGGTSGQGNTIANGTYGIVVETGSTGICITGNAIYNNSNAGFDLTAGTTADGVTLNDGNDADGGGNLRQNFHLITQAELGGTDLTLSGSLDTDGAATPCRIEFFGNTAGTQDATHGEGRYYLGSTTVTTNGSGDAIFSGVILNEVTFGGGDFLTATPTRIESAGQVGTNDLLAYGSTSECAMNYAIVAGNAAPYFTSLPTADPETMETLAGATSVTSGDFDNDGDVDLVTTTTAGELRWHENDGSGNFSAGVLIASAQNFRAVATYDLQGDSDLDIVAMNDHNADAANSVLVLMNNFVGSGTVSLSTQSFEGSVGGDSDGGQELAIGDIDGDGRADIAGIFYRSIGDSQLVVFEQNAVGVWTKTYSDAISNGHGVEIVVLDGDTDMDIVNGDFQTREITFYEYDGNPTVGFTPQLIYDDVAEQILCMPVGDFDADGDQDIAYITWGTTDKIVLLENDGAAKPSFTYSIIATETGGLLYHMEAADINGDGTLDVIIADEVGDSIYIYENAGDATFTRNVVDASSRGRVWVEAADVEVTVKKKSSLRLMTTILWGSTSIRAVVAIFAAPSTKTQRFQV